MSKLLNICFLAHKLFYHVVAAVFESLKKERKRVLKYWKNKW